MLEFNEYLSHLHFITGNEVVQCTSVYKSFKKGSITLGPLKGLIQTMSCTSILHRDEVWKEF